MTANLNIVCMHETEVFLRLVLEKYENYANDEICHAANWVIHQLRSEVKNASRIGYIFDRDCFHGGIEKETPLTTNGIFSILHECQVFHHHELRISVEEEPFRLEDEVPTRKYVPEYPDNQMIVDLFKCVEHKQKSFCPPVADEEKFFDENDVSFTEFLKKLENRQKDIMKGIELALEALTEDVFQPQLPGPEHEVFFDTSDNFGEREPLLEQREDVETFLDKIIDELLGKVDSLGVKNRRYEYVDDLVSIEEKKASEWNDELSKMEKEAHLETLEKKTDLRSKLSMTVATSTVVQGKTGQTPAETQTDKESGSEDEIAIIRHALSVIQKKRRKMSSIGKKSPEMKKKKLRLSRSPKCCCCRKEKKEVEKTEKKTSTEKVEKKKEKKTDSWPLGPIGSEWKKEHKHKPFDLMAELEKALPTVSEPEEPFNRKLREKWAHDGMKSLKRNTPIYSVRMPASSKIPSRFHRFQPAEGHHQDDDQYCDKFNLARLDGKLYKLVPRFSGITTPLNKNYPGQSTVPTTVHMAVVDESDPWLNWDMHYLKTYRALNVGSKVLKGLSVHVVQASNVEIARDLSKIPVYVPMDYSVDFQLVFNLIDKEKEGHCVMQLKDEEGIVVSPAFVFLGNKIERPYSPAKPQSDVYDSSEEPFEVPEVVSSSEQDTIAAEEQEESGGHEEYQMVIIDDVDLTPPEEGPMDDFVYVSENEI